MPEIVNPMSAFFLWAAIAYLIGSIPSGVVIARVMGLGNLREIGSGNIGATNVLRTGNKTAAALTLLFDAGKGIIAVLLACKFAGADVAQLAAFMAMIGHCFPVWLKFRGGKGVATFFGVVFGLAWPVGICAALTWLLTAAVLRYSSLAALVASAIAPVAALFLAPTTAFLMLCLCALIFLRHGDNIRRLFAGEESKIGQK